MRLNSLMLSSYTGKLATYLKAKGIPFGYAGMNTAMRYRSSAKCLTCRSFGIHSADKKSWED